MEKASNLILIRILISRRLLDNAMYDKLLIEVSISLNASAQMLSAEKWIFHSFCMQMWITQINWNYPRAILMAS